MSDQSNFNNTKTIIKVDGIIHTAGKTQKYCEENKSVTEYFGETSDKFLQKCICLNLPPHIDKCIECHIYKDKTNITSHELDKISCRFFAFRQLKYSDSRELVVAGFPDPHDSEKEDLNMWLPSDLSSDPTSFNIKISEKILCDTGRQFCMFIKDEIDALKCNLQYKKKPQQILWKKFVNGVRDMCDVCKTTIFNHHFCCCKCGFEVCIDCYRAKVKRNLLEKQKVSHRHLDKKNWLPCSNQKKHKIENLCITQILAGDALKTISKLMHDTCRTHNIHLECSCNKTLEKIIIPNSTDPIFENLLNIYEQFHTADKNDYHEEPSKLNTLIFSTPGNYVEDTIHPVEDIKRKECLPPKISLLSDDKTLAPHMWLCNGRLLRLLDPKSDENYEIFQEQWKRGQPVLVSDVGNKLNSSLWHPESFSRDFGNQINDLVDCSTSDFISDQPMSTFWNGFENSKKRLCDEKGNEMLLKLKDWPSSADFSEILQDRFQDLMNCLPLKEYTHRNGKYNLASMLPDYYVRPDLGPKMYAAYGSAGTIHRKVGTTNLHLDISDAVNVMVYVAITKNSKEYDYDWHMTQALKVINEAGCDDLTLRRINIHREIPGALWHIYHASDADLIRNFLMKYALEHGTPLDKITDPIHDQTYYLNKRIRDRLFKEYGIKGYTIVQYYGDAVFIPAGAPHQVRNLHNCIKVAEEFVSPENVHYSFRMTQEFRYLTDDHNNHEDKLQIKNILFHAVKDSISILKHTSQKP